MSEHAAPVGGRIVTPFTSVLAVLAAIGGVLVVWRFAVGLGPSTGLSDGYPWGIWIGFDVVTGTALACGGYAMAFLVYVLNRGRFHPLLRPAMLTSALGYTIGGLSIVVDVGRPWGFWRVPGMPWLWNGDSVLLEIALCMIAYTTVLWIELAPVFLEGFRQGRPGTLQRLGARLSPVMDKALPFIIPLGLVLPTMHQSSLGTLIMATGHKVHPLWQSSWLPFTFLVACIVMGYAVVVAESALSMTLFGRKPETAMLRRLTGPIAVLVAFLGLFRLADVALSGELPLIFAGGTAGAFFVLELVLAFAGAAVLWSGRNTFGLRGLFRGAMLVALAAGLYRFDTYLIAFDPGANWSYFPTAPETLITVGFVAAEILAYVVIVKRFPVLGGLVARPRAQEGTP